MTAPERDDPRGETRRALVRLGTGSFVGLAGLAALAIWWVDDLVPDYLDAIPIDPYGSGALRYDRERRLVWSVGEDLRDAGGETFYRAGYEWETEPTLIVPERER